MKAKDRMELLEKVASELQRLYTYSDLDIYLKSKAVDVSKSTSSVNSKRVYAKEILAQHSDEVLVDIAEDLELVAPVSKKGAVPVAMNDRPGFWLPGYFRVFISHLASFKGGAGALRTALLSYGISGFVAHDDIKPTKEWQSEIVAGLKSMDAFIAILEKGFPSSNWCDQEVGFAVARNVFVIPLIRDLNPYGFIGKVQGLKVAGKSASVVAKDVYGLLLDNDGTRDQLVSAVVAALAQAVSVHDAVFKLDLLEELPSVPRSLLDQLRAAAGRSLVLSTGKALIRLNGLLQRHGVAPVGESSKVHVLVEDDDIPF